MQRFESSSQPASPVSAGHFPLLGKRPGFRRFVGPTAVPTVEMWCSSVAKRPIYAASRSALRREVISLYRRRYADRIIAETNNGGTRVEAILRMVDPDVSYHSVWTSRGEVTGAEPVSALYEQGRVHHVGSFPRLEDQMCVFTVDFNRNEMGPSPDRVDALVWALTELMVDGGGRRLLIA